MTTFISSIGRSQPTAEESAAKYQFENLTRVSEKAGNMSDRIAALLAQPPAPTPAEPTLSPELLRVSEKSTRWAARLQQIAALRADEEDPDFVTPTSWSLTSTCSILEQLSDDGASVPLGIFPDSEGGVSLEVPNSPELSIIAVGINQNGYITLDTFDPEAGPGSFRSTRGATVRLAAKALDVGRRP